MSRLVCGDCLDILCSIPDKSIDLVICDPPYEVKAHKAGGNIEKRWNVEDLEKIQDITKGYDIRSFAEKIMRVMKVPNIYFFCNKKQIPQYLSTWVTEYKCSYEILCWHKQNAMPTYSNKYLTDTEYCLYFHKGKCRPPTYENARTYWIMPINTKDKAKFAHPTIKPMEIIKTLVENSSEKGELVLDPFMGSGTTGVACNELGRDFYGIEINETYFKIAETRIEGMD